MIANRIITAAAARRPRFFAIAGCFSSSSHPPSNEYLLQKGMPLLAKAAEHANSGRILSYDRFDVPESGDKSRKEAYSYHEVLSISTHLHEFFKRKQSALQTSVDTSPQRVTFLCRPGHQYISTQFACWSSGSIAVPLCTSHTSNQFRHVLEDSDPYLIIDGSSNTATSELRKAAEEVGFLDRYHCLDDIMLDFDSSQTIDGYAVGSHGDIKSIDSPALIIYTSGTTGKPKGVVHTHRNIYHQVTDLVTSWGWTSDDAILHFLPLHHVHGVINKLACAIYAGGSVEFVQFHPIKIWKRLAEASKTRNLKLSAGNYKDKHDEHEKREPTIFMAVPTVYAKMLEALPENVDVKESCSHLRLMVCGSAALPAGTHRRWKDLTGHTILERYGMTEMCMALSNPLFPEKKRLPGYVGLPLPSVEVKIVSEDTGEAAQCGELCVRGPTVFSEYWRNRKATEESFDDEGFFRTGDIAAYDQDVLSYRILGRLSADIIKSSGFKLSALEIERELLEHPDLAEVVVLGIPDDLKGESVALICRMSSPAARDIELKELQDWCKGRMPSYQIPTALLIQKEIPKNAMGKVMKKSLVHLFNKG